MITLTTNGVSVSVNTDYQEDYSNPSQKHFVFTYRIRIENHSDYTVQLMRRRWLIMDADGSLKEVDGEGVVGQQPVLEPGESHEYVSGCNLRAGMGLMQGYYTMQRMMDGKNFDVAIPEFHLFAPYLLN
jgi:ApaG protein